MSFFVGFTLCVCMGTNLTGCAIVADITAGMEEGRAGGEVNGYRAF